MLLEVKPLSEDGGGACRDMTPHLHKVLNAAMLYKIKRRCFNEFEHFNVSIK